MIIKGNSHTDYRGTVRFVNDFNFEGIKRFYTIAHNDIETIRAWQGHKCETKYFYVTKGSFQVNWIEIDNWDKPSQGLKVNSRILSDQQSEILIVGPGHANGFKALEFESSMIIYSNKTLQESKDDDFRFPLDFWEFKN